MTSTPHPTETIGEGVFETLEPDALAVVVGSVGDAWRDALSNALPHGRVLTISATEATETGLDRVAEEQKLLDLHLLVIAADVPAGRVLAHAGRLIGIFQPLIALLGPEPLLASLLEDLDYVERPLPSGVRLLHPSDAGGLL